MKLLAITLLTLASSVVAFAQISNDKLRVELLAMREKDQTAREQCDKGTADERMVCYGKIAEDVDKPHTTRLKQILDSTGFPVTTAVGKDGLEAFYLLLQHSADIELKKRCLADITKAFEAKQLAAMDYANFTDRLLVNLDKPQVYGTNFEFKDGKLVMSPAEDITKLDERRKKIGLPTMAEYVKVLRDVYKMDVVDPLQP